MMELVFLLEELSAKSMLESLLPRLLNNQSISPRYVVFEGKQDLEKNLMLKIRAYQNPRARFIVMRDQDSAPECLVVKQKLLKLCDDAGKVDKCLVRIACTELEAFYIGDLQAVEQALELRGLAQKQQTQKFRTPDRLNNPSQELKNSQKIAMKKWQGLVP